MKVFVIQRAVQNGNLLQHIQIKSEDFERLNGIQDLIYYNIMIKMATL